MKSVTVRELLASLPDTPVYAGRDGLDKTINTISFIDAPNSVDWLKGGEVILTTAFLYKGDSEKQTEFVQKMLDKDVVALGIKFGRYIEALPDSVLELANLHHFPIFGISYDTVWSEIFSAFYSLSIHRESERNILSTKMITFEKLFRSSNWGSESIRTNFLECVGLSAVIVDDAYNIISSNNGSAMDTLSTYCESRHKYHTQDYSPERIIVAHEKKRRKIYDTTLYKGERLLLCTEEGETIRESKLEWITILYKSVRNKNKFAYGSPGLWKDFLLECVVGGSDENFKEYARALSLRDGQLSIFVILSGAAKTDVCNEFKRIQRSVLPKAVVHDAEINDGIVLLCTRESEEDAAGFTNQIRSELSSVAAEYPEIKIRAGSCADKLNLLRASYNDAQITVSLCKILFPDGKIAFYSDVEIFKRLCFAEQDYSEIDFLQKQITSFDACRTLEIYLENSNIKKAAECAFIHDNTMRYRLQKIGKCLNMDISKPINRLNLLLKIKLWRIMSSKTKEKNGKEEKP